MTLPDSILRPMMTSVLKAAGVQEFVPMPPSVMKVGAFDEHAEGYIEEVDAATHFSGKGAEYFAKRKAEVLLSILEKHAGQPSSLAVLDIGCGVGITDEYLSGPLGELHGVDTSPASIGYAKLRNPGVSYRQSELGSPLPHADAEFDVAFAICVLHHVDPGERWAFMHEASRVVRDGGLLVIFEHNPLNPLTRRVVRSCAFDKGVELLSRSDTLSLRTPELDVVEAKFTTFLPFDRKWVASFESGLGWLPLGAQFYVVFRKRSGIRRG